MDIYILTIHHIHNFGSVFQAAALCSFLKDNGYDAKIVDYRPRYYELGRNRWKTILGRALNYPSYSRRKQKFENFIRSYQRLTDIQYLTDAELSKLDQDDALFIAGGDQLWNSYHPCGNDPVYKLNFVKRGKKVAFGTSIGRCNLSMEEKIALAEATNDFILIGLREASTVAMMKAFSKAKLMHMADPVALYDGGWYTDRFVHERVIQQPYAMVYLVKPSVLLDAAIEKLKAKGYRIIRVSGFYKKCDCDELIKDAGPEEILSYLYHADFVLSASFHATLFSILFEKQFASLLPGRNTNARIEDILNYTGLSDRLIVSQNELDAMYGQIDYRQARERIAELRNTAIKSILSVCGEIKA